MHELSICEALLAQVEVLARQHQASRVTCIELRLGPLAGVEAELLQHAFTVARAGTLAADAQLHIIPAAVTIRCQACQHQADVPANCLVCPACQSWQTQVLSGDEMILQRVEMLSP